MGNGNEDQAAVDGERRWKTYEPCGGRLRKRPRTSRRWDAFKDKLEKKKICYMQCQKAQKCYDRRTFQGEMQEKITAICVNLTAEAKLNVFKERVH